MKTAEQSGRVADFVVISQARFAAADPPSLAKQIAWVRERAGDAEELRGLLVTSGHVNANKAARDAEMWKAVLSTLQALASILTD